MSSQPDGVMVTTDTIVVYNMLQIDSVIENPPESMLIALLLKTGQEKG
jgi:hypothetical protein